MILYVFITIKLRINIYTDTDMSNMIHVNTIRKEIKHGSKKQEGIHF